MILAALSQPLRLVALGGLADGPGHQVGQRMRGLVAARPGRRIVVGAAAP
ncbi:MAG: hypothetical protein LPJ95_05970 [Paracoccaceae bacterium]|nr:hypothetical protein [Paracoccaceae bacterium]